MGSFSYTPYTGFFLCQELSCISRADVFFFFFFLILGCFSYTSRVCFFFLFFWGLPLTHPVLATLFLRSFSYTSRARFSFISWPSLTHPMLVLYLPGEFLLHISCWLNFYLGSFSYTSHTGLIFMRGVSYTSHADSFFMWGVSLTHPMLALFLSGEFFLHIPCWLYFSVESFSDTSHDGFFF